MAIAIQDNPILAIGQEFTLRWTDWYRLICHDNAPQAIVTNPIIAKVVRIYASSDRLLYVCRTVGGDMGWAYQNWLGAEFVLESFPQTSADFALLPQCQVSIANPDHR